MSKIGIIQLCSKFDKALNYSIYSKLICDAAGSGCKIAFLPEAFDFIGRNKNETFELAETINGEIISNMKKLAKDASIWLSLGGFHRKLDLEERIANSHVLINDEGEIVQIYDKIHLFDAPLGKKNQIIH